jgi:prepilin-type N-terminal cleavage/methylation domain-containing protein
MNGALHNDRRKNRGFTLIELLVVISIIGLLASIVIAGLNSARERAKVISLVRTLKTVEQAFQLLGNDQEWNTWRTECSFASCPPPDPDPHISTLVTDTANLGKFLASSPSVPMGEDMAYDNDGNTFTCGAPGMQVYHGINIQIDEIPNNIATQVNQIIDSDGDLTCGRIRYRLHPDKRLYYMLSATQRF